MRISVDRWALPIVLLAVFAAAVLSFGGCGKGSSSSSAAPVDDDASPDDDDNDDNDASPDDDDDASPDDDTSPDDDDNDDNDDNDDSANEITVTPGTQTIPATTSFTYAASGTIDGAPVTSGFTWSIDDQTIATVDQTGAVKGVKNGKTTVHAAIGQVRGDATVLVGPDVYAFDNQGGVLEAIDRGSQTAVPDLLGAGAIGALLNDIRFYDGTLLLTDSGSGKVTPNGKEKLIVVTLDGLTYVDVALAQAAPWASTALNGKAYVTGNLDDSLAKVDLGNPGGVPVAYFKLDTGCVPAGVIGANNLVFVACTGFDDTNFTYAPGKVLVFDPSQGAITNTIAMPQVNPTNFAVTADGAKLYTVCTGDYASNTGVVAQLDPVGLTVVTSFALGTSPGPIGIASSGLAFVAEGMAGDVYVFNTANGNNVLRGAANPITIANANWVQALGVHPETGDVYACDQGHGKVWALAGADPYGVVFSVALNSPGGVAFWAD